MATTDASTSPVVTVSGSPSSASSTASWVRGQLEAELGLAVDPPPQLDGVVEPAPGVVEQAVEHVRSHAATVDPSRQSPYGQCRHPESQHSPRATRYAAVSTNNPVSGSRYPSSPAS